MDDFFSPIGGINMAINQGYDSVSGLQYHMVGGPSIGPAITLDYGSGVAGAWSGAVLQTAGAGLAVVGLPAVGLPVAAVGVAVQAQSFMPPAEVYSPAGQAVIDGFNGAAFGPQAPAGVPFMPYEADPVSNDWFFSGG